MKDINELSEEEQIRLLKSYAFGIQNIRNPSEAVKLVAVRIYGYSIHFF